MIMMWSFRAIAAVVALLAPLAVNASRLEPPVLPLIVRNPYLSTWLQNAREEPWKEWPMFWTGAHVGFSIMASLPHDRIAFPLLGRPQDSLQSDDKSYNISYPEYQGAQYDASTTNLSYIIRDPQNHRSEAQITISFLSPITPNSTFRQSIPASYITFSVVGDTDVDIYMDLNGQWVSGDRGSKIEWEITTTGQDDATKGLKTWKVRRATEQIFTEVNDQAEWGTLFFSGPSSVRYESGTSRLLRQRFCRTGTLQNQNDNDFRGIMDEEPVFAFSTSFRANETSPRHGGKSVLFTIAHIQDPVIQFAAARGLTFMRPLWQSYIPSTEDLLAFHYVDFDFAALLAKDYSVQLAKDAFKSGAEDYADIVAISARQVMGATHFVGTPDDPLLFLKEISSDGNTQTIDVIFPAFPFFMYTNSRWLAYMLEPLIEHMLSGQYPNKYAMHDIGAHYPNATGHPDGRDEYMPVEECGNILIMGLALANAIKDGTKSSVPATWTPMENTVPVTPSATKFFPLNTGQQNGQQFIDDPWLGTPQSLTQAQDWVKHSYKLWKQWTQYLVEFSLEPENQLSTDDFAGWLALQTNLALKGIIGIKAMAGLADIINQTEDVKIYTNISNVYIQKWEEFGISRDKTHAKLAYDWFGSWTTIYNLFADSLLCFHLDKNDKDSAESVLPSSLGGSQQPMQSGNKGKSGFVPEHIYQMSSDWYYAVRQKYGLPLDSRHLYTKTDWEFFAMAVAAPKVRAVILESVARWVNETSTDRPLTDLHDTEHDGGFPGPDFFARPVIGGHFAFLALERACGGRAMEGLTFLNDDVTEKARIDVTALLQQEIDTGTRR